MSTDNNQNQNRNQVKRFTAEELKAREQLNQERRNSYYQENPSHQVPKFPTPFSINPQFRTLYKADGTIDREYLSDFSEQNSRKYKVQSSSTKDNLWNNKPKISAWKLKRELKVARRLKRESDAMEMFMKKISDWLKYSPFALEIINLLLWFGKTLPETFPSYQDLSTRIGCCPKTIQRTTDGIDEINLITKNVQYKQSNRYQFSKLIFTQEFITLFGQFFPALREVQVISKAALDKLSTKGVHLTNFIINNISYRVPIVDRVPIVEISEDTKITIDCL